MEAEAWKEDGTPTQQVNSGWATWATRVSWQASRGPWGPCNRAPPRQPGVHSVVDQVGPILPLLTLSYEHHRVPSVHSPGMFVTCQTLTTNLVSRSEHRLSPAISQTGKPRLRRDERSQSQAQGSPVSHSPDTMHLTSVP